jgi:DegV family protein with EDD domain
MKRVSIVTDSTADIPDHLVEALQIHVVHDYINYGTESLQDQVDISRTEFYQRLVSEPELPTTSSPSVGEFEAVFRQAGAAAADGSIISLHPPPEFSALCNTAVLAARSFPEGTVTVVDSGQVTMGLGWLVIAAARAAQAGASREEITQLVREMMPRVHVFAALDTFEFLRRSGRVSWATSVVGTLLRIKPMIEVRASHINALDRVRTGNRAMARLVALTQGLVPIESLAIMHTNWPEGAEELHSRLGDLDLQEDIFAVDVTPVIGVHVGPRGLGVAAVRAV